MNPKSLAAALVMAAISSGENVERAVERTAQLFGESSAVEIRSAIGQSAWAAAPRGSKVQIELMRQRLVGRRAGRALVRYAIAVAVGLTLTVLALVMPSSVEVGLDGW